MPKDNIATSKDQALTKNWITSDKFRNQLSNSFLTGKKNKTITAKDRKKTSVNYYHALQTQRKYSPHRTMRLCGKGLQYHNESGIVTCAISENGVSVRGVAFCQSPFCVTCMGYQRTQRRKKIEKGLIQARRHDYPAYFVTLTIERTNDIEKQVKDLFYGWKLLQDRLSYRMKKQGVKVFMVRNLDITFKPESHAIFHTHLHCIVILDQEMKPFTDRKTKKKITNFSDFLKNSWVAIQTKKNIKCSLQGQHIEKVENDKKLSRYVSKFEGLACELSYFAHKTGKNNKLCKKSIGYMELLGFVHKENEKCISVYKQFLLAMHGCRTVAFSRNWNTKEEIEIDGKKEEIITEILLLPFAEREEEEKETKVHEIFILPDWFSFLKSKFDKFILCLHHAFLDGEIGMVEQWLEQKPSYHAIDDLFLYYKVLNL